MEKFKNIIFALIIFASGFVAPFVYIKKNGLAVNSFEFSWYFLILAGSYAIIVLSLTIAALNIKGPKISTEEQDEMLREIIRYYGKIIEPYILALFGILLLYSVISFLIAFKIIPKFWL
jgi:hypothetical protein